MAISVQLPNVLCVIIIPLRILSIKYIKIHEKKAARSSLSLEGQ